MARAANYTLVIAPEIDGILEDRARRVLSAGGRLLGPDPDAILLTADKYTLYQHFVKHHVPTPYTRRFAEVVGSMDPALLPGVLKPRYGAGSLAMRLVRSPEDIGAAVEANPTVEFLLQQYVPGEAVSVVFLNGPEQCVSLRPARQTLSEDGHFHYLGGSAPVKEPLAKRARNLGRAAVRSVPGVCGYVGVDLVLGRRSDGREDYVIEINPRLTTSYIGLRRLTRNNLAAAMLDVVRSRTVRLLWTRGCRATWAPGGCFNITPPGRGTG
jgi:predicted ATP-grasp superfamily ATP-dependent carboligase